MIITKRGVRVGKHKKFVECECGSYVIPNKDKCHMCGRQLDYHDLSTFEKINNISKMTKEQYEDAVRKSFK